MPPNTGILARRDVIRHLEIDREILDRLEELQIIVPVYRPGRERAYRLEDVDCLRVYQVLVRELGVNSAGAEIILRMRNQLLQIQERMSVLLCEMKAQGLLEQVKEILASLEQEL